MYKIVCSVPVMDMTFQQRMAVVIEIVGSQSELVRQIEERYGIKMKPQRIQYLCSEKVPKPAKGSRITAQIAGVAGLRAEWLASGKGQREEAPKPVHAVENRATHTELGPVEIIVKETGERHWMELSQQAIEVASLFMDLSKKERMKFYRALKAEHQNHVEDSPAREFRPVVSAVRKVIPLKAKKGGAR